MEMQTYAWTCTLIMIAFACDTGIAQDLLNGCTYCENGTVTQNPDIPPSSNGCGSYGVTIDMKWCPYLNNCCDQHDLCYDRCDTTKAVCDQAFLTCTQNPPAGCLRKVYCKLTGQLMYEGVNLAACDAFLNARKRICFCTYP